MHDLYMHFFFKRFELSLEIVVKIEPISLQLKYSIRRESVFANPSIPELFINKVK
jgi:hypothetical protein